MAATPVCLIFSVDPGHMCKLFQCTSILIARACSGSTSAGKAATIGTAAAVGPEMQKYFRRGAMNVSDADQHVIGQAWLMTCRHGDSHQLDLVAVSYCNKMPARVHVLKIFSSDTVCCRASASCPSLLLQAPAVGVAWACTHANLATMKMLANCSRKSETSMLQLTPPTYLPSRRRSLKLTRRQRLSCRSSAWRWDVHAVACSNEAQGGRVLTHVTCPVVPGWFVKSCTS